MHETRLLVSGMVKMWDENSGDRGFLEKLRRVRIPFNRIGR